MILNPYFALILALGPVTGVSALPRRNMTIAARDSVRRPAMPCTDEAPYACDGPGTDNQFCCADAAHCVQPSSLFSDGGWDCRNPCEAFEKPCMNGLSCCPEGFQCGVNGSCISNGTVPIQCDPGEAPCGKACCMNDERCDDSKGVCIASSDPETAKLPPPPKNETSVTAHHRNDSEPESASSLINSGVTLADLSFSGLFSVIVLLSTAVYAGRG
ncbi:hypothetical protein AURDEDRAFT_121074 [Auricularia subglabra TFB-10046 SS5]|nr:hypothetical protein AURDEDRAFT_121074 [Auricularia subglabra TFB-10046 SS5]